MLAKYIKVENRNDADYTPEATYYVDCNNGDFQKAKKNYISDIEFE
jgi:hypothetical protein